eukprot:m51a1_g11359 putative zinc finger mynd domain-containing protein 10-like (952) ;mRNA; f:2518-17202
MTCTSSQAVLETMDLMDKTTPNAETGLLQLLLSKTMGDKVIVEIVLADVGLTESQQDVLARGLQASAHRHAEDHFFTYLKWSLDIMRDTALSVSKESITEAGVKQAQSGEKQKKMKESTLDNKKIKATSELNVAAIESKGVLFSKFFESPNNCKKVALIASKLMTWKPEDVQKLFHEISKIEGIDKIPSSALEMTTLWSLSVDNVLRFIRRAATEKLTRDQCRQLFQSIQDSYHIYSLVKDFISALDSDDKEQRSFSKTQLRVLKNAVRSGWLSDYVDCPASDFELQMGPVTAAIMWGKLTKESEINAASKNMEKNSILSEKPVMVNWNELVYPAKVYKEVSLEFSRCMDRCCTNFFLRDCWTQCYGLYKSFRPNIMLVDMSALQSPDDLRDYIPKLNPLVIPLILTGEHVWDQTPNRHIHYNLVVNFLSSKARDKFTSLLKLTFLALKSDPLELLHGSSKPTIDYTTVHDLLHFMSIAALELTGDKPMHRTRNLPANDTNAILSMMDMDEGHECVARIDVEQVVGSLQPRGVRHVGSATWVRQHSVLNRLNVQAHKNAASGCDEYIVEALVSLEKMGVLVNELVATELWRDNVLPRVIKRCSPNSQSLMTCSIALYHESVVVNLLEVCLYSRDACVALGEASADLAAYCVRCLARATTTASSRSTASDARPEAERAAEEHLASVRQHAEFGCSVGSLSILRYLTDHASLLPLSFLDSLLDDNDVLPLLMALMERPPWVRRGESGGRERWNDGAWAAVDAGDEARVTKTEAQLWLLLNNLLVDPACRSKITWNSSKKDAILRQVRRFLVDEVVDQIPVLVDLRRALDELAIFDAPPATSVPRSVVVSSGSAAIRDALVREAAGEWDAIASEVMERAPEGASAVRELAGVFRERTFEELSETPTCAKCGKAATKRCSRCRNEWYCGRACQVADWQHHKPSCDVVFEDLKTKS